MLHLSFIYEHIRFGGWKHSIRKINKKEPADALLLNR
jgi:hypothetical protein